MKNLVTSHYFSVIFRRREKESKLPTRRLLKGVSCLVALGIAMDLPLVLGQGPSEVEINPGHSGVWFNPDTSGQGFLLDILPDSNIAFLSWFTYDTSLPGQVETAQVGDPGHRWLTAQGPLNGNSATLNVSITSGGLFDDPTPVVNASGGSITLTFDDCSSGTVDYNLTSAGVSGSIPISRVVNDNVALCEAIGGASGLKSSTAQQTTTNLSAGSKPALTSRKMAFANNCKINPGHNGVWYNPDTSGQGFLLDVLPETNIAFLSWFTYDTNLPDQDESAQVGYPGHRWLTAQGPLNGNSATLNVSITSGGLFDNPAPVVNAPGGSITLTFENCAAGTVDYNLTSAGISGSIPITRVVNDNVDLCESLCGEIVVEESGKQSAVHGLDGGVLDISDIQGNVSRLTLPEGVLVGPGDQLIEAFPLAQQTILPTGDNAIAGLHWSLEPGAMIGPAKLEVYSAKVVNYKNIAAFSYGREGEVFYFLPLFVKEDHGVVLEVPMIHPGTIGLAYLTADEMEMWSPPNNPPEAKYLQKMAIAVKRYTESGGFAQVASGGVQMQQSGGHALAKPMKDAPDFSELFLAGLKEWFDNEISPNLGAAHGGCDSVDDFVATGVLWLSWIQEEGLDGHQELASRVNTLESAFSDFASAAGQDISILDHACDSEPDICKQMEIMQGGAACAQTLQYLGADSSAPNLACANAPAVLSVSPRNQSRCPGGAIQFNADVININGEVVSVDQFNLRWSSEPKNLLTIDPESGAANTLAEGRAWVNATSEVCGKAMEGSALVNINGIPDLAGSYSLFGAETDWGCQDPEDNGTWGGSGSLNITMGAGNSQSGSASFSGTSSGPGFGMQFSGTVSCDGSLSGSGTYSDEGASGVSNFSGVFLGNTIMIYGTGQDLIGDTCSGTGWANATR